MKFSTGRSTRSDGFVTCNPDNMFLAEGYDCDLQIYDSDGSWSLEQGLTKAEAVELADAMIARWQTFKANAQKRRGEQ